MRIGNRVFDTVNRTYCMGILNITPDSFSDGGKYKELDVALKRTEQMIEEGASIIDIGGESTRPGYTMLSESEEMERIAPVIEAVKARFDIPVSLDTYKSKVALAGIKAGADMINDIWGLKYDADMANVIAEHDVACCLMHNRKEAVYKDFLQDMAGDMTETIQIAARAGIAGHNIILDPGIGFAKTYEQNLLMINHIDSLHMFGYPILLGTSRKSVIGLTLDLPVEERLEGTLATTTMAVLKGCTFVRVHDVKENMRIIRMTEAIRNSQ
ncbi:MAG: dihydropteroate synthase [Lachnospiraceae bacterium]|nr:dihydropteroate synthase [Lachnospiraceae bacterium]